MTRIAQRSRRLALIIILALAAWPVRAAELKPETIQTFDRYVQQAEARMDQDLKPGRPFFWVDALPQAEGADDYRRLRQGEILVQKIAAGEDLPGGMVHDWIALAFVPNATLQQTLAVLHDYDNDYRTYAPEVLRSKLLQRNDNHFQVFLRIRKESFVTVVLDINNAVSYHHMSPTRAYSRSYSSRIVEVEDADRPQEHERPPGDDHGYLWRLYTYWRFLQQDGGVYIQCWAIALTRGIPAGLGWLIKPFVTKIPHESLVFTITRSREAVLQDQRRETIAGDRRRLSSLHSLSPL